MYGNQMAAENITKRYAKNLNIIRNRLRTVAPILKEIKKIDSAIKSMSDIFSLQEPSS